MSLYRRALPQLSSRLFLTDGGLETTLVFHQQIDLPYFAAFDLLKTDVGYQRIKAYYRKYAAIAQNNGLGFVLESPTWRASRDWGEKLGYDAGSLAQANRKAINLLTEIRGELAGYDSPLVISGCLGPRGDGYQPGHTMTIEEAEAYHRVQIAVFSDTEADMVSAMTLNYVEEAIGICRAARAHDMPVVISFTVETDGRLPTGQNLGDAIETVDRETGNTPIYYMINCAHPTHFEQAIARGETWVQRVHSVRANASQCSHAELDAATELDAGNPDELGQQYRALMGKMPNLRILGGCCGTDHRHIEAIVHQCHPGTAAITGTK